MDYYSATTDDEAASERELRQQKRQEMLAQQDQRQQEAEAIKGKKGKAGGLSAGKIKKGTKDWAINLLLPKWGFFRWCRASFRGEAMDANKFAMIFVNLFRNINSCLVSLVILTIVVLISLWYGSSTWEKIKIILGMGLRTIWDFVKLFISS